MIIETSAFLPFLDEAGRVTEPAADYVRRMKATVLPHWPEEVLKEWLHREVGAKGRYAFLGFEKFSLVRETWPAERFPAREAFDDPILCDNFSRNFETRLDPQYGHDCLAHFMAEHGTWNTPIVMLSNAEGLHSFPDGEPLKAPYHLLEGHRRLSFFVALRAEGKVRSHHDVWVVTIPAFGEDRSKLSGAPDV